MENSNKETNNASVSVSVSPTTTCTSKRNKKSSRSRSIVSFFDSICFEQGERDAIIIGRPSSKTTTTTTSSANGDGIPCENPQLSPLSSSSSLCYYELQHASQTLASQLLYRYRPTYVLLDLRNGVAAEVVAMLACMRICVPFVPVSIDEYHVGDRLRTVVQTLQTSDRASTRDNDKLQSTEETNRIKIVAIVRCKDDTDPIVTNFANAGVHNVIYLNDNGDMLEPMDVPQSIQQLSPVQQHEDGDDDDLYVLFTSGTSGKRPKAVVGSHQSTMNRLLWFGEKFPSTYRTVVVRRSKLTFVDSITEVFSSLLFPPSRLYALPPDELSARGISILLQSPHKDIITRVTMLPSQLSQLLIGMTPNYYQDDCLSIEQDERQMEKKHHSSLEMIIISGEPCPEGLLLQYQKTKWLSTTKLLNLYGQTESTGDVACAILTDMKRPVVNHVVAVGSPIPGVTMSSDSNNQLLISGNLSNGYLKSNIQSHNHPSFDPFGTGDIGFCQDGIWYVKGRSDDMCKINGVLTSPSEVETAFTSVYSSKQDGGTRGCQSVACIINKEVYMLVDDSRGKKIRFRRETMRDAGIPWNLIPKMIFFRPSIPTSSGGAGKVDRTRVKQIIQECLRQLRDDSDSPKRTAGSAPKINHADKFLTVVSEVLGVTVTENSSSSFVELGGDSALAVTLLYKFKVEGICQNDKLTAKNIIESDTLQCLRQMLLADHEEEKAIKSLKRRRIERNEHIPTVAFNPRPLSRISKHHIGVQFKACVDAAPLIYGNSVYGACQGGVVQRIKLDDTKKVCGCYDLGWKIQASMVVVKDESLIVCGYDLDGNKGIVVAIDLALEKAPKWAKEVSGTIKSTPVVVDGNLYVVSGRTLNVIHPIDGTCIIRQELPSEIESKPAIVTRDGSSTVIYAFSDWEVGVAIVEKSGSVMNVIPHSSLAPVYADLLTIDDNRVVICDIAGFFHNLCVQTLKFSQCTKVTTKPIFSGPILLQDDHIVIGCHDGVLRCIDKVEFSKTYWEVDAKAVVYAKSTAINNNQVVACTTAGDILKIKDGKCVWRYMIGGEIWSDAVMYDGKSADGKCVLAVGARDSRMHLIYLPEDET